jgi:TetR/AcrR family transcriptional regulator
MNKRSVTASRGAGAKWTDENTDQGRRHDLRRETILKAAARCFNRKGFRGTTIGDIARELNVSKAALYYYVKDKEALLFTCHETSLDIGVEALRLAEDAGGTPADKLMFVLRYSIEHMTDSLKGCVMLLEDGMLSPRLRRHIVERRDDYERRIRALVKAGVACGQFVPCDPKPIVFAMLGAMNWIPKWYVPEGAMTPKEIGEAFASYLTRGLLVARTAPLDGARATANASESADRRKARVRRPARPRAVGGRA